MISTILIALAGLCLVVLRRFPSMSARQGRVNKTVRTQYSSNVCGDQPLPTLQKKPIAPMQPADGRQPHHSSMVEGW
jgi:hypothetical protein